ncbi:MAG: YabP/YqfC family sporulation protein [Oscillospiraceae bacterium]|nr:YabP/YqfC family sporulation protein [Oscillospiraceae bacterium]
MPRGKRNAGNRNKRGYGVASRALDLFDIPLELAPGVSKLTVTGDSTVYVERHRGLVEYDDGVIAVKTGGGITRFYGEGLSLTAMSGDELLIRGGLERIEFKF